MIRAGIIGASGYAGAELVRYLLTHPDVQITYLASGTYAGRPLSDAYPAFLGRSLPDCEQYDLKTAAAAADIFFQAQGNGVGMKLAPGLLEHGKKLIDVPADFRIKDLEVYSSYYRMQHTAPDLAAEAVYGIPEFRQAEIAAARIVANPGCYSTAALLALAPLMKHGLADPATIVIDAKSGVSGAGRSKIDVDGLFCEVNEGFRAYAVAGHRHTAEIEQELSIISGGEVKVSFTPHLVPMNRGILTTIYASVAADGRTPGAAELLDAYNSFYADSPFVVILDRGKQPNTKNVFGTNHCHIGLAVDGRVGRAIITCAIDNMGKGAAGQAVQNMNLMCGLDEGTGLLGTAVFP